MVYRIGRHVVTEPENTRNYLRRGCVFAVGAGLIVLLAVCALGMFSVREGTMAVPWFDTRLGIVRVVGYTTWNDNCPPFTGCDPTLREAYVIWAIAGKQHTRVLRLPIEH